jgi:hypothetical protein
MNKKETLLFVAGMIITIAIGYIVLGDIVTQQNALCLVDNTTCVTQWVS